MNAQTKITVESINAAYAVAEKRWFLNRDVATVAKGIEKSEDLKKGLKSWSADTAAYCGQLVSESGIEADTFLKACADTLSVKALMRLPEFMQALHAGNYAKLDGVTCLEILCAATAGGATRQAIAFAATGKGDDNTSAVVKNVSLIRKLQKVLSKVGASTEPTQNSRSFGKGGFCVALGVARMTKDEHGQRVLSVSTDNPVYKRVSDLVSKASDETLKQVKGAKKDK